MCFTMYINPSQKVRKLKFDRLYLFSYEIIVVIFDITWTSMYPSLKWYHICKHHGYGVCVVHLRMGEGQKWNVTKCAKKLQSEGLTLASRYFSSSNSFDDEYLDNESILLNTVSVKCLFNYLSNDTSLGMIMKPG